MGYGWDVIALWYCVIQTWFKHLKNEDNIVLTKPGSKLKKKKKKEEDNAIKVSS